MNREEAFKKITEIIAPFVKEKALLDNATDSTRFLEDLKINSARLVDIVISFEDAFNVEIPDEEAGKITSIGSAVDLMTKKSK